ncbi:MAG: glycosyltransferase family 4 protein [Cyanosarcina radialis HA8281-LM2]|jgi:glycosyltransferase involved in cell wall biosynthesis|nr:glycosyltransferase family 4 protein [Cyanosarcina radialis HA8281-LM2]
MSQPKLVYISFDIVPAPKGAAIHIEAFTRSLAEAFGEIQLVTVSPTSKGTNAKEIWPGVIQTTLPAIGDTLINRVLYFRTMLGVWWDKRRFDVVHIRSIYEGFPIAINKQQLCDQLIFEVNGLPSIELKYRYPKVAEDRELLQKLTAQEQICLEASDLILTPSCVTRDFLQKRGVPATKIRIIPNGVNLNIFSPSPHLPISPSPSPFHILYFGTLSAWQGVNLAVEALALVNRDFPAKLTIVGAAGSTTNSQNTRYFQSLKQLAIELGVGDRLTLLPPVSQIELVGYLQAADAIVAPLTANDRNLIQGCCPLKILEGMASGTPVISSDLPVVRELGVSGEHFLLVKPGSAKAIKDAFCQLHSDPELANKLAIAARDRIVSRYTWQQAGEALVNSYDELKIN